MPLFNEEGSVCQLYEELTSSLAKLPDFATYEIIFVDDGSTDKTHELCIQLNEKDPQHVTVVRLRKNFGQTAALAAGFDHATGNLIAPMDGDLQNDPQDLVEMVKIYDEGFDVVKGWRKDRKDPFFSRRLPSQLANKLISWITGVKLHDYGCTLSIYRADILKNVGMYGEMHRFLPALAAWQGAKIKEISVNHRARQFGTSRYGNDRIVPLLLEFMTVKFCVAYSTSPMQIFGWWGLLAFIAGGLSASISVIRKFFPPFEDMTGTPWLYIFIFFVLSGLQLISIGLLGEINVRTYFDGEKRKVYTVKATKPRSQ